MVVHELFQCFGRVQPFDGFSLVFIKPVIPSTHTLPAQHEMFEFNCVSDIWPGRAVPLHTFSCVFQRSPVLTEHTLSSFSVNLRHSGLHVAPASAEVAPELAQGIDAQFLFEVGLLLLFGGQDLPQRAYLLLQLDTDNKNRSLTLSHHRAVAVFRPFWHKLCLTLA